ncbi:hypothetical protein Tco_0399921, partial [Tanacetum coccineum]
IIVENGVSWAIKDALNEIVAHVKIRAFDGHQELRQAPILVSGDDILDQLKGVDFLFENVEKSPWKKKNIFFKLPYLKNLLMCHNLDVMHIEKGEGRDVKEKQCGIVDTSAKGMSSDDSMGLIAKKIRDIECKMLKATRAVVGDINGVPECGNEDNPMGAVVGDKNVSNEVVRNTLRSFASLVSNEACSRKGRLDYARTLIEIRADRELKNAMIISIPNVEDDGEGGNLKLHGYGAKKGNVSSSSKGPTNSNAINLGDLRNSFEALKDKDNMILNVGISTTEKVCNTVNHSESPWMRVRVMLRISTMRLLNTWLVEAQMMQAFYRLKITTPMIL